MIARMVHKGFFWIGIAAAIAISFVPVFMGAGSSRSGGNFGAALGAALAPVLVIALFVIIAVTASLVALIAAYVARASPRAKLLCGLPVLLASLTCTVTMLILIGGGTFR